MSSINHLIMQTKMALINSNDGDTVAVTVAGDDDYHDHHFVTSLAKATISSSSSINQPTMDDAGNHNNQQQHIEQSSFVPNELIAKSFAKYYPEEANFWMYAMIVLGLAFIVFVAITIYKLCQPEKDGRSLKQQRSGSVPGTMTVGPPPTTIVS
ncbi:uncharacterized protein LOC124496090 [Dermatophagoides farinae]|uniref:uncharacterized protein LOC124496090 n=1 Tax=Dermatophagoides farinae TaxID=6954 RepID=UPI003F623D3D